MIPEIGIMVAGYIFVRVLDMITQPIGDRPAWAVKMVMFFGALSMLATIFISLDLLLGSHSTNVPGFP
jgi:hypothetical protein